MLEGSFKLTLAENLRPRVEPFEQFAFGGAVEEDDVSVDDRHDRMQEVIDLMALESGAQRLQLVWPDDQARRRHDEENERKQCEDAVERESSGGVRQLVPSPLATERACKAAPFG